MITPEIISKLQADESFVAALSKASSFAEALAITNGKGYSFTEADLEQFLDSEEFAEIPLNAEQLALVSGGGSYMGSKRRNGADQMPAADQ